MVESIVAVGAIGAIKIVGACYDVLTLPVYTLLQKPWREWKKRGLVFSEPVVPGQPLTSGMRRINSQKGSAIDDSIRTVDKLMKMTIKKRIDCQCVGVREIFSEEEEKQPDGKIFKKYTMGDYHWITFREYDEKIDVVAAGLLQLGVRPRQNVGIFAETRMEWMLTAQALFRNNIALVTLYATLGTEAIIRAINETEITHFVTSQDLLDKVLEMLPHVSSLTHIIYMENQASKFVPPVVKGINLISFSKLLEIGLIAEKELTGETPSADDLAIIMYTSGSSGDPKGVMISQSNIVSAVRGYTSVFADMSEKDTYIAYLPLAHVMEIICELLVLSMGPRIAYSSPLTLTDKGTGIKAGQRGDAVVIKPTLMLSVPLVLDRVRKAILESAEANGTFSKLLLHHAISYKTFWRKAGYRTPILNKIIFNKIKAVLGGQVRVLAVGSAPVCSETYDFIMACLDPCLVNGYGLTESSSGAIITDYADTLQGSAGSPLGGNIARIVDWEEGGYTTRDQPRPRGELLIGGATVAKGYYKNEALTKETFFEENGVRWCRTGDIVELFPQGVVRIIDRKKDLVKLQFGEYVALGKVEAALKTSLLVDNICVYGDPLATYLVALISPNPKALEQLAKQTGVDPTGLSLRQLCENPEVARAATAQLIRHGKLCNLNKMEIPQKIKLCSEDWLPDTGLVTAALKICRKKIQAFYKRDLDRMYEATTSMHGV